MYLPVPGFEPTSSVFPADCVTYWATVADVVVCSYHFMHNLSLHIMFTKLGIYFLSNHGVKLNLNKF